MGDATLPHHSPRFASSFGLNINDSIKILSLLSVHHELQLCYSCTEPFRLHAIFICTSVADLISLSYLIILYKSSKPCSRDFAFLFS
jgi:hypothetical protein